MAKIVNTFVSMMNDLTLILDADWKQRFYGANMKDYIDEPDYSHNYIVNHDKVED